MRREFGVSGTSKTVAARLRGRPARSPAASASRLLAQGCGRGCLHSSHRRRVAAL